MNRALQRSSARPFAVGTICLGLKMGCFPKCNPPGTNPGFSLSKHPGKTREGSLFQLLSGNSSWDILVDGWRARVSHAQNFSEDACARATFGSPSYFLLVDHDSRTNIFFEAARGCEADCMFSSDVGPTQCPGSTLAEPELAVSVVLMLKEGCSSLK